jgi:CSLREA domain-containing protein
MRTPRFIATGLWLLVVVLVLGACGRTVNEPRGDLSTLSQVASGPVVNSLADPGTGTCDETECTLREAIAFASASSTITFSVSGTITLVSGELLLGKNLTISGPGRSSLTVSGNDERRVFNITTGAEVAISGLTVTGGLATRGGGVWNQGVLTLGHCAVSGNYARSAGGGIANDAGTLAITQCEISGNTGGGGGGIYTDGTLTITQSTISGNNSANTGGGIYSATDSDFSVSSTTVVNSTISGNTAQHGGGINNMNGLTRIVLSTVTGNHSGEVSAGGGVTSYNDETTRTDVKGSIIWGNHSGSANTPDDVAAWDSFTRFNSLGYNLIGAEVSDYVDFNQEFNQTGDQTDVADAGLGPLALNAPGPTQTHALLTGSPAINTGTCTDHTGAAVATDQRGVSRPQGSACDIGAYELSGTSAPITPTFTFDLSSLPAKTYGDGDFSVAGYVTTNSSGTVTFATGAGSVGCTVTSAGMVTITSAAVAPNACTIEATLAPDATYAGAGPIAQSFHIAKAAGSVSISNLSTSATVGGSFTPEYAKLGDGTASTTSLTTGVCTVSGGVVSFDAAGTCTLQALVTEGTNHLAATGAEQSFTIAPAGPVFSSSCTYTINAKNSQRAVTVAWQNAVPGVTLIEVSNGRAVTKQQAPTATGSWSTKVTGGTPTYGLWGGTSRKDAGTELVPAGTACTQEP